MNTETEAAWIQVPYFAFWDVPRTLLLPYKSRVFLLDSSFDDERDDYCPTYSVWELADVTLQQAESLPPAEWEAHKTRQWPDLPVAALKFAPERERQDGRFYVKLQFAELGQAFPEAFLSPA